MEIDKVQIWTKTRMLETEIKSQEDIEKLSEKLKELIETKWEPKEHNHDIYQIMGDGSFCKDASSDNYRLYGNEWPTREAAVIARDMNKRNQLILQYKLEKGYGDGDYDIYFHGPSKEWRVADSVWFRNPELTFRTRIQAEDTIKALGLNES